jgi:hypothetical protein
MNKSLKAGILLIAACSLYAITRMGAQKQREAMMKEIDDFFAVNPSPARVSHTQGEYRKLLEAVEAGSPVTATEITRAVTPDLLRTCGSPLLQEKEESLSPVFTLGQLVVSNLLNTSSVGVDELLRMSAVYSWIVRGLRQEPGMMPRIAAVALENGFLDELLAGRTDGDSTRKELYSAVVLHDYLFETSAYAYAYLIAIQRQPRHGIFSDTRHADPLTLEIIRFVKKMPFVPRNYAELQQEAEALRQRFESPPASLNHNAILTLFDALLLPDIKLHEKKSFFHTSQILSPSFENDLIKSSN